MYFLTHLEHHQHYRLRWLPCAFTLSISDCGNCLVSKIPNCNAQQELNSIWETCEFLDLEIRRYIWM